MTIHWKAVEHYFGVVLFVILENLSSLNWELLGMKGLKIKTYPRVRAYEKTGKVLYSVTAE